MRYFNILLVAMLCISSFSTQAAGASPRPLSMGFMPYLNAEHLIEKYSPLAEYLTRRLKRPVEITVAKDYAEHLRLTGEDKLDISFLGGSPYVVIGDQYGKKPLLVRYEFEGRPTFRAVIFVAEESPLQSLQELAGKRVAFGSKKSTLSTQVPLHMLMQAGVGLNELGAHEHLRNHENVVLGVEFGDFEAGAVAEEVFREQSKKHAIRALAYSQPLSTHVFVTRKDMPAALREKIRSALMDLKQEKGGAAVLGAIGAKLTSFVPVQDGDYDTHREILSVVLPVLEQ